MVNPSKTSLVVCVEDDKAVRESLLGLLFASGIQAVAFGSAEAFLASDELHFASCLVTDIQLGGISGLDLLQKLTEMSRQLPSILITGHSDVAASERALNSEALCIFVKPVDPMVLLSSVKSVLRSRPDQHPPD
jgi:FixJ family two-component response regulator